MSEIISIHFLVELLPSLVVKVPTIEDILWSFFIKVIKKNLASRSIGLSVRHLIIKRFTYVDFFEGYDHSGSWGKWVK
jgi:hypothetical protein